MMTVMMMGREDEDDEGEGKEEERGEETMLPERTEVCPASLWDVSSFFSVELRCSFRRRVCCSSVAPSLLVGLLCSSCPLLVFLYSDGVSLHASLYLPPSLTTSLALSLSFSCRRVSLYLPCFPLSLQLYTSLSPSLSLSISQLLTSVSLSLSPSLSSLQL